MLGFDRIDWRAIFVPDTPLLEIIIRGSLVYLGIFVLLRVVLKRQTAALSVTDLLVVVLLADAAQNAMAADYKSVPDGLLLVAVIVGWSLAIDWLGHRFESVQKLVHPPPLPLVRDGRFIVENMRRELITRGELMSQLREQGIEDLGEVGTACLEGDGRISVIRRDKQQTRAPERVVE